MPRSDDRNRAGAVRPGVLIAVLGASVVAAIGIGALLVSIGERRGEARSSYDLVSPVGEDTTDPEIWGANWPSQYESYLRTTDWERTRHGGSDAIPRQKLEEDPWLRAERFGDRLDRTEVDIMPVEGVTPDSLAPGRDGPTVPGSPNRQ